MNSFDLEDFKGTNNVLLVSSPHNYDFTLSALYKVFDNNRTDFNQRDIKIFHLTDLNIKKPFGARIPDSSKVDLMDCFGVPESEFVMILIGKDGIEKLRTNDIIQADILFDLIDSIPPTKAVKK
ncbi:MAG: DUF4174 domain-containing protein [Balneolaceae bacterium]|nr:DUF4174 domain-containing protein [Balneolaceae bacterium]